MEKVKVDLEIQITTLKNEISEYTKKIDEMVSKINELEYTN